MGRFHACEGVMYLMKLTCFSGMVIKGESRAIPVSGWVVAMQLWEKHQQQCSTSETIRHVAADVSPTHLCQEDSWPLGRA